MLAHTFMRLQMYGGASTCGSGYTNKHTTAEQWYSEATAAGPAVANATLPGHAGAVSCEHRAGLRSVLLAQTAGAPPLKVECNGTRCVACAGATPRSPHLCGRIKLFVRTHIPHVNCVQLLLEVRRLDEEQLDELRDGGPEERRDFPGVQGEVRRGGAARVAAQRVAAAVAREGAHGGEEVLDAAGAEGRSSQW